VLGECLGSRGEYAVAIKVAHDGLILAEEIEHHQWIVYGHWVLGALYLDLLVLPEARHSLERALALAHEVGSLNWIHIVSGSLAQVLLLQQDPALADSILTSALEPDAAMQTIGQRLVWAARAELAFARHDPDLALDIVDQLIASATNLSDECVIPRLWKLRGEALAALHRTAEAETILQAAQTAAHARGLRPWYWRICITLGKLYLTQTREDRAEQAFSTARTLIEELVSSISDEHLRVQFLSQATAMLPRSHSALPEHTVKQMSGGLTAREREVATLVAQGKTNREAAEVLVVNYRTIEKHIENILAKLGFTSRVQIAMWASENGLGEKERS
jgi:non-specific serine/threonine protein kinase